MTPWQTKKTADNRNLYSCNGTCRSHRRPSAKQVICTPSVMPVAMLNHAMAVAGRAQKAWDDLRSQQEGQADARPHALEEQRGTVLLLLIVGADDANE
eukprot:CAMPEP_0195119614 /NCGR_PEP_ID=MMETSP0448-20130528/119872_1 /TAXON_ID=66468 /ORGANISM="Heterocapsa triquestra, Strain CCMP 448" /LENGTH=97 /DNA_ID=CAMNT_0040156959 /DNA_START=71 /DNA_END=360 /DNA_ORIENTATION=+